MTHRDFRSLLARPLQIAGAMMLVAAVYLVAASNPSSGAGEAATATPNTNLHSGDTVHVHATGFPPRTTLAVIMCTHAPLSSADCEGQSSDVSGSTDGSGVFDLDYTVLTWPNDIFLSSSIQCDGSHDCDILVAVDFNDFSQPKALAPIHFASGTVATTTTMATTSTTTPPTTTTTASTTTTTAAGGTTSTTSSSGSTTTTSSGSTTSTSAATAAASGSTTTTTLGPLGTGVTAANTPAPAGGAADPPSASGAGASTSGTGGPVDPSAVQAQSLGASDPATLPATGVPRLAPWLAVLGLMALFGGSVARRMMLKAPRGP